MNRLKRIPKSDYLLCAILFGFGLYLSITCFGHQVVPNSDFSAFVGLGHQILSGHVPGDAKRAPVVGVLQAILSGLVGGAHSDLTAGWLLNAILYPFILILLWRVAGKLIGQSAAWCIALIAMINPWAIQMLTEPIAEVPLLFCILLTFYFMVKPSKWCYLIASITTLVRYEGAILILIAFAMDMIRGPNRKARIRAALYTFGALLPLMIWQHRAIINWQSLGATHYLKEMGARSGGRIVWREYLGLIWNSCIYPLLNLEVISSQQSFAGWLNVSKIITGISFVFGAVYGCYRRQGKIIALLVFLTGYFFIHAVHSVVRPRFSVPINWIVLIICIYGWREAWRSITNNGERYRKITIGLQVGVLGIASVWLAKLISYLPNVEKISQISRRVYLAAGIVIVAILLGNVFARKFRCLWRNLVITSVMLLIIVSNQYVLVDVVGDGQGDIEFKQLADWYLLHAAPGEKMLTTMPGIVSIFAPQYSDSFIHTGDIQADSPDEFAQKCLQKDVSLVAWDSRLGFNVGGRYYQLWGLKNIKMLNWPVSTGPYEFVTTIRASQKRFINIFRLQKNRFQTQQEP